MKHLKRSIAGTALLAISGAANALSFNYTFVAGTSAQAQQGFIDAGARWSALFSDNITLDMTVGTARWALASWRPPARARQASPTAPFGPRWSPT